MLDICKEKLLKIFDDQAFALKTMKTDLSTLSPTEYKKYHEAYVQNNHGSTAFHTFCCLFFTVQCTMYITVQKARPTYRQYVYEYFVIVLPMILAYTVLAHYIYILNCIMLCILSYKFLFNCKNALIKFKRINKLTNGTLPIISSLRGLIYSITVLCIVAVNFRAFPRYLAKTERFGFSLMDTGVGLFITMSGIVNKDLHKESFKNIVKEYTKLCVFLLILGVARFFSVKQLDCQKHVTEYGVHWIFFFTIAVCRTMTFILLYFLEHPLFLSAVCLIIHEFVLYIGLKDWVFSDSPRNTLMSANREGICSCLGYVSIYLFAVYIRHMLLNVNVTKLYILMKLACVSVLVWILSYWHLIHPASRTLANAGYCLFIDAILITITTIMFFVSVLCDDKDNIQIPLILSTVNTNGLLYFLYANLCTGAINLSVRTLCVSSRVTFFILNVYMAVSLIVILCFKKLGLTI